MTTSFTDLGVSARVIEALGKVGVSDPFAIQSLVLQDAIAGRDVLARSATGSSDQAPTAEGRRDRTWQPEP